MEEIFDPTRGERATVPTDEDALLTRIFRVPVHPQILPKELGHCGTHPDLALPLAFAPYLDVALSLTVDLIKVVSSQRHQLAESHASVGHEGKHGVVTEAQWRRRVADAQHCLQVLDRERFDKI